TCYCHNGQTPGPVLSTAVGDTIIINVVNNLIMEIVAIHWHGIRQRLRTRAQLKINLPTSLLIL
ncbi:hypothetical protein CUMW_216210, partial [Citrus unshiu]